MSCSLHKDDIENLKALTSEGLDLAKLVLDAGKQALLKDPALLTRLPLAVYDMGTLQAMRSTCTTEPCACGGLTAASRWISHPRTMRNI